MSATGRATRDIKIEFRMEAAQITAAMDRVGKKFELSAQQITKMSSAMSHMVSNTKKMEGTMKGMSTKMDSMTSSTLKMAADVSKHFSNWGTLLNDNNQKITSAINKMIALNQQNNAQNKAMTAQKQLQKEEKEGLSATFARLKTLNLAWNWIRDGIAASNKDLTEFNSRIKTLSNLTGEKEGFLSNSIFALSNRSGTDINSIAKALQDASNEGNTLSKSFEKIQAGIVLANKSMGTFENSIARIDDIVDQFGVSADQALGIVVGKNISSERSLNVFARLGRDAKEAGLDIHMFSSTISVMSNEAGIAERSLQIGFRAILNGLQDIGENGQKMFFEKILPNWSKLDDATKRQVENMLHLRKNDEFLKQWGERYERIAEQSSNYLMNQEKINEQAKQMPVTELMRWNTLWNETLQTINLIGGSLTSMILKTLEAIRVQERLRDLRYVFTGEDSKNAIMGGGMSSSNPIAIQKSQQLIGINETLARLTKERTEYEASLDTYLAKNVWSEDQVLKRKELVRDLRVKENEELRKRVTIERELQDIQNKDRQARERTLQNERALGLTGPLGAKVNPFLTPEAHEIATATEEMAKRYQQDLMKAETQSIKRAEWTERIERNKVASLQAQIVLWGQVEEKMQKEINFQKSLQRDESYWAEAENQQRNAYIKKLEARAKLKEMGQKDADAVVAQHNKQMEINKNEYDTQRNHIIDLKQQEKISGDQAVFNLTEIQKLLKGNKNEKELISIATKEIHKIETENANLQRDTATFLESHGSKMHRSILKEQLDSSRDRIRFNSKDKDLTEEQKLQFKLKELDLQRQFANEDRMYKDNELTSEQAIAMYKQRTQELSRQMQSEAAMNHTNNVASIRLEMTAEDQKLTTRLNGIKAVVNADAERELTMRQSWERTHQTTMTAISSIGSGMNTIIGTTLSKLITNTGDLSHMWGQFAKKVAMDVASKAFSIFLGTMIGGGAPAKSFLGRLGKAIMGGANGTSLTGVPGYAMGSPVRGVDTVPAMLSPGEIVLDRNASDVFRGMASGGGGLGGGTTIIIQSNPTLLGNREELIRLDAALNNPIVRTSADRRRF